MPFENFATARDQSGERESLEARRKRKIPKLNVVDELDSSSTLNVRKPQGDSFSILMKEVVPVLFERAIDEQKPDPFIAFVQLSNAFKYGLENFLEMKKRFLDFIDKELAKPLELSINNYQTLLKNLRNNALDEKFGEATEETDAGAVAVEPLDQSDEETARAEKELSEGELQVTLHGFENAMTNKDIYWGYQHLVAAKKFLIPSFSDMIREFVALVDQVLKKDETTLALDYRNYLLELREKALAEKF